MKGILDDLPLKDRQALAHLYETDDYKVLKKVLELLRINAATFTLEAQNFEEVKHLAGQAHGLKMLHQHMKENHKKMSKD